MAPIKKPLYSQEEEDRVLREAADVDTATMDESNIPEEEGVSTESSYTPNFAPINDVSEFIKNRNVDNALREIEARKVLEDPYVPTASDNTVRGLGTLASLLGGALGGGKMGLVDAIPGGIKGANELAANSVSAREDATLKELAALDLKTALQDKSQMQKQGIDSLSEVNKLAQQGVLKKQQMDDTRAFRKDMIDQGTEKIKSLKEIAVSKKQEAAVNEMTKRIEGKVKEADEAILPGHEFSSTNIPTKAQKEEAQKTVLKYIPIQQATSEAVSIYQKYAKEGKPVPPDQQNLISNKLDLALKEFYNLGASYSSQEMARIQAIIPSLDLNTAIKKLSPEEFMKAARANMLEKDPLQALTRLNDSMNDVYLAKIGSLGYVNPRIKYNPEVAKSAGIITLKNGLAVGSNSAPALQGLALRLKTKEDMQAAATALNASDTDLYRANRLLSRSRKSPITSLVNQYLGMGE